MLSNLIKSEHFKCLSLQVVFHNDTSETDCLESTQCKIFEIKEDQMVIAVPKMSCNIGHYLTIYILNSPAPVKLLKLDKEKMLKKSAMFSGRVDSVELSQNEYQNLITVQLLQYDSYRWPRIIDMIRSMQEKISELVHR